MRKGAIGTRTTLREVAEAVGVSTNTVSKVLNGSQSNTRVSEKTRSEIEEAAARLRYRPNEVARSLVLRRTRLIGLFAQFEYLSSKNEFLSELVGGMQEAAAQHDYDLVLHTIPFGSPTDNVERSLTDQRVDGLVIFAPSNPGLIHRLGASQLPMINVVDHHADVPTIGVDDEAGGRIIARHLAEKGHRTVIYRDWFQPPPSAVVRRRGFWNEANALQMRVIEGKAMDLSHDGGLEEREREAVRQGATAFFVWGDTSAAATCDGLEDAGYRVPSDVAVAGFNGIPVPTRPRWDLTTIRAPWRAVGSRAVNRVLELIEGISVPDFEMLPVEFITGKTT